ncbi:MAG: hypothetical protein AAFQ94_21525 [Bacteroidota bacterium]
MRLNYYFVIIVAASLLVSCGEISERFTLIMRMNQELQENFNHQPISISFGMGTEKADNFLRVTFANFAVDTVREESFEKMSAMVSEFIYERYPEVHEMAYIEVVFSSGLGTEDGENYYSYKIENGIIPAEETFEEI